MIRLKNGPMKQNFFPSSRLLKEKESDFLKLWMGETVSFFGTQISNVAFPLTAVTLLGASAKEVGLLNALAYIPFLLFTLFVGVYVERSRKKPILILSNFMKGLLLLSIPLALAFDVLTIELMYIVAFLTGVFTVFFDATFQIYIPFLISKENLVKANSRIMASSSTATVAGPGLGGFLIQLFGAGGAIFIDAISYFFSAFCLNSIKKNEPVQELTNRKLNLKAEILEGLSYVFKNSYIRPIMANAATYNLFSQMFWTVFFLYATKRLDLSASMIGIIFSVGGVGSIIGSMFAEKTAKTWGIGPATILAMILADSCLLLIPMAEEFRVILPVIFLGVFLNGIGLALSNVTCTTIRQSMIPERIMARALAGSRVITWGATPIGALIGGLFGSWFGLRETMFIGTIGLLLAPLWVIFSPLRTLKGEHIKTKG